MNHAAREGAHGLDFNVALRRTNAAVMFRVTCRCFRRVFDLGIANAILDQSVAGGIIMMQLSNISVLAG